MYARYTHPHRTLFALAALSLAAGCTGEDTAAPSDDALGAGSWVQQSMPSTDGRYNPPLNRGRSVALSGDGSLLDIGTKGNVAELRTRTGTGAGARWDYTGSGIPSGTTYDKVDYNGGARALARNGKVWVVGASQRAVTNAAGMSLAGAGGVSVLELQSNGSLLEVARLQASNADAQDHFGTNVAVSSDGSTIAVAATFEDSGAKGVGGDSSSNSVDGSGAVYIFKRTGNTWKQEAYVKATTPYRDGRFGQELELSADGSTLLASSQEHRWASSVVLHTFTRTGATWVPQADLKPSNRSTDLHLLADGRLALSDDGKTLAFCESQQTNVFVRSGQTWAPQTATLNSGTSVALSANGNVMVIGNGSYEYATIYTRGVTVWLRAAEFKARTPDTNDRPHFGDAVAISADGRTVAVGAPYSDSSTTRYDSSNINAEYSRSDLVDLGAAFVFSR